jgi:hypothetical protein
MNTVSTASSFVDLVLKHDNWDKIRKLPAKDVRLLFDIVSAAGFEPREVVPGKLKGDYLDQDGSRTGKTYPINDSCPFTVIDQEDDEDYFATGWLDCAFRRVLFGASRQKESREELITAIAAEIERSVPLPPIQLTRDGDSLSEYPPNPLQIDPFEYFIDHTRDDRKLSLCVGVHQHCNGWMDRQSATKTHDALICRRCHIRVLFPKEVVTYGELRQALSKEQV